MPILFALGAAFGYGISDFAGGIAARRIGPLAVLISGYPVGTVLIAGCLPLCPGTLTIRAALLAGAAGMSGVAGLGMLYRLMAKTALHVVAPITAVMAAALPLAFGLAVAGEHPSMLAGLGLVAGLGAVVLINGGNRAKPRPVRAGVIGQAVLCGSCFGAYFVLIAQTGKSAGISALLVARVVAFLALTLTAHQVGGSPGPTTRTRTAIATIGIRRMAVLCGLADAAADISFLLSTRSGNLSISGVIAAQYPVITVLLAVTVLRERAGWRPVTGLGLTVVSLAFLAH